MGEGVPKLMRVEAVAEPGLSSSLSDDLSDTAIGQPALSTDPEPGKISVRRALPHSDIAIEGTHRLGANSNDALAPPFADDTQDALVEVHVV